MTHIDKQNQFSYLKFFFGILRFKMFFTILLNVLIGFLDGIGLTMLIPMLQSMEGSDKTKQSMGQLKHFISFLEGMGLSITVSVILLVFLCIFIIKAALKYFAVRYQNKVQEFFIRKIQMQFVTNIRRMSYKGFLELDAGNIQNTVIADVWRMSEAMKRYLLWINSIFMSLTYVVLAYLANPKFALIITVGVLLTNIFYTRMFRKIKAASYEISQKGQRFNSYLIELVHYFKYLKSTNYINQYSQKLKGVINEQYALNRSASRYGAIIGTIKEPVVVFIVVGVILIQIHWVGGGIASIILALLLFYRGLNHMMSSQNDWQTFLYNSGAFRTVSEVSDKMKSFEEPTGSRPFTHLKEGIAIENVSLSFGKTKVLNEVSVRIPKNTTIALTGVSGSGKTTLVNIISGLLKPDNGRIMVDGIALADYNLGEYRSKIGYISQESVIFNDTIFNNVTFWAEPTEENINRFWEVVKMSSMNQFIDHQQDKEQTRLGDNGILISGGQRQRISIARELFKKPEILILDEATSALDSETERVIQENIERLHGHYTMIIIAHRLSTIKNVDEIYLLEKGRVVHSGKFYDMLEQSSTFKHLVTLQGL
jgi:ABC-type multidrug transport system fused ATPase/permease subunit